MSNCMTISRLSRALLRKWAFLSRLSDINNIVNDSACVTFASNLASILSEIPLARLPLIVRHFTDAVCTSLVVIIIPRTYNTHVFVYVFGCYVQIMVVGLLYPRHTGGAVPLRFLVKTDITAVTPPVVFHSFSPTRHNCLPQ